jgi:glucose-1-phosphate adenylyltransferase
MFKPEVLTELLVGTTTVDFGREVIPQALGPYNVHAYPHNGYWTDIGTIPSFHQANLDLTLPLPPLNLYDPELRIFTHPRFLPGTKVNECSVRCSILSEGSILSGSHIVDSIIGVRAVVSSGSVIERSIVMGANNWENEPPPGDGQIPMGIGRDCHLRNTIIDFNARIGDGCKLLNAEGIENADSEHWSIRDRIIVVHKNAVIPPGTVI